MKKETFGFTIETAYGQKLDKAITASAEYDAYESIDEIREKGEFPSDKEIVNFVNAKAKASARASETLKALTAAGHEKPTLETSEKLRFNTMLNALMAGKVPEAEARQQINALLGTSF